MKTPPPLPITIEYATPTNVGDSGRTARLALAVLVWVALLWSVLAWLLASFVNINTVLMTGPLLVGLSLVIVVLSLTTQRVIGVLPGIAHVMAVATMAVTSASFGWDLDQSARMVVFGGLAYLTIAIPLTLVAGAKVSNRSDA